MTNKRYARLAPYTPHEKEKLAVEMLNFFRARDDEAICKILGKEKRAGVSTVFGFFDFLRWMEKAKGQNRISEIWQLRALASALERAGFLEPINNDLNNKLYRTFFELSTLAGKGTLFLGKALGPDFIASKLGPILVSIQGTTKDGDRAVGTGINLGESIILTCKHVVEDMIPDKHVHIASQSFEITKIHKADEPTDLAFIEINSGPKSFPDLAFRNAQLLESVLLAGYPTIPTALGLVSVFQTGEISGYADKTYFGESLLLFSTIVRPGNSGGPIISMDGRILGIVTRDLLRQPEKADSLPTTPFFAAIPANIIRTKATELLPAFKLPWEDYQ